MRRSTLLFLLLFLFLACLSAWIRPKDAVADERERRRQATRELAALHREALQHLSRHGEILPTVADLASGSADLPVRDPWGHPYEIRAGHAGFPVEVVSAGADGSIDTDDDLSSLVGR